MQRPLGVTILAIIDFLGVGLCILLGLLFLVGMGLLSTFLNKANESGIPAGFLAGFAVLIAIIFFFLAAVVGLLGYGMWTLKNWARIITLVLVVLGLVVRAFVMLWSLAHFHVFAIVSISIRIGIDLLILWYLMQPHVKQAFGA